jgi:hypothetical protein
MNINGIESRDEAINHVVMGLAYLIQNHANCAACEQWAPSRTGDESDEYIRNHKEWVKKLRKLREEFEDIASGDTL